MSNEAKVSYREEDGGSIQHKEMENVLFLSRGRVQFLLCLVIRARTCFFGYSEETSLSPWKKLKEVYADVVLGNLKSNLPPLPTP